MELKKLHTEVLNDLYSSPNIILDDQIEKNEMGGPCNSYGGGVYKRFWCET